MRWQVDKVIDVTPVEDRRLAVPGAGTDHRYPGARWTTDISTSRTGCMVTCGSMTSANPAKPKLTGQLWLGGLIGKAAAVRGESWPADRRCCNSAWMANVCT